jgi:hypothetical protein
MAGDGELEILPGTGHLLVEVAEHLRTRLRAWIDDVFDRPLEASDA